MLNFKNKDMATEDYNYTEQQHEAWLRKLEGQFKEASIDENFRYINTLINVKVVKADYCTLKLTLDFSEKNPSKERGCILCVYGYLNQIRSCISHETNSWDNAIILFKDLVETLDFSSLEVVKSRFKSL